MVTANLRANRLAALSAWAAPHNPKDAALDSGGVGGGNPAANAGLMRLRHTYWVVTSGPQFGLVKASTQRVVPKSAISVRSHLVSKQGVGAGRGEARGSPKVGGPKGGRGRGGGGQGVGSGSKAKASKSSSGASSSGGDSGGGGGSEVLLMASRDTLTNKRVEKMMVQLVKLIEASSRYMHASSNQ